MDNTKKNINVLLLNPRGFCAGVTRAIEIVEKVLQKYGAPIYVRHEIVHNAFVVKQLENKGAIFVDEIDEVPKGRPVIFSAHGVPECVVKNTKKRGLIYFDATCPLVEKVHLKVKKYYAEGRKIILIGHAAHPEVIGTMGQLPEGEIFLLENENDLAKLDKKEFANAAFVTQTTLSVDETTDIVLKLKEMFPGVVTSSKDICYATTNRQIAVKQVSDRVDMLIVVGSHNSSNSKRLVEVALKAGVKKAILVEDETKLIWSDFDDVASLGITAGASAPEKLIEGIIATLKDKFEVSLKETGIGEVKLRFKLSPQLDEQSGR